MKHKFNIGDIVKVLNGLYVGIKGCVVEYHKAEIGKRKGLVYTVKHSDGNIPDGLYWSNELKLVGKISKTKEGEHGVIYCPYVMAETCHTITDETSEEEIRSWDPEYYDFMKNYRNLHKVCPNCGSKHYSTTLVGYAYHHDKPEEYKDLNSVTCYECGWHGVIHDLVPEKDTSE